MQERFRLNQLRPLSILSFMKLRRVLIPTLLAVLVTSFVPHVADAAKAPEAKAKKYSVTMKKAYLPAAPNKGTDDYRYFYLIQKLVQIQLFEVLNLSHSVKIMFTTQLSFV